MLAALVNHGGQFFSRGAARRGQHQQPALAQAAARLDLFHRIAAREIAAISALPDKARAAFGLIAARVERSLFALRRLEAGDWQAARAAYAEFALERLPTGAMA